MSASRNDGKVYSATDLLIKYTPREELTKIQEYVSACPVPGAETIAEKIGAALDGTYTGPGPGFTPANPPVTPLHPASDTFKPVMARAPVALTLHQRLRRANAAASSLPELGVQITPTGDGRVQISLPAEMAELFLVDLDLRSQEWQKAMRQARMAEIQLNVDKEIATGDTRRQVEQTEDRWRQAYDELRQGGHAHRQALHLLRGDRPARESPQIGELEIMIANSKARLRYQRRTTE